MSTSSRTLGSAASAAALIAISGSTNATPIVITVGANSGLGTGSRLAIAGITGNTNANGIWTLTMLTATTFSLDGSVGNGAHGGTPRAGIVFDRTPGMQNHSGTLITEGNFVGTLLLESFMSYDEFAAGDNSKLGVVTAPVQVSSYSFLTNTNATAASSSTVASSAIVFTATNEGLSLPVKLPLIMRPSVSAYTSGSLFSRVVV
jgi:hypothetical protein